MKRLALAICGFISVGVLAGAAQSGLAPAKTSQPRH